MTDFDRFYNSLRVLLNIDADEFYAAVHPEKHQYRLPMPDQVANWIAFRDSPHTWFIRASDKDARAIWTIIEKRNEK